MKKDIKVLEDIKAIRNSKEPVHLTINGENIGVFVSAEYWNDMCKIDILKRALYEGDLDILLDDNLNSIEEVRELLRKRLL